MNMKIHFIIGGSWFRTASNLRASSRRRIGPSYRFNYLGFRLVKG